MKEEDENERDGRECVSIQYLKRSTQNLGSTLSKALRPLLFFSVLLISPPLLVL
jgi:hypothetical protein